MKNSDLIPAMIFEDSGAMFHEGKKYRLSLWRIWDSAKPKAMFIGLNPSTANESENDPTIKRVITMAKNWDYGGIFMLNLFPFVTAFPDQLEIDPQLLDQNDEIINLTAPLCHRIIFAWGNFKQARERAEVMFDSFPMALCLAINKNGSPKHPLYIKGNTVPIIYPLPTDFLLKQ